MPAPQAMMMKQLARLKFSTFGLKAPANWQAPTGSAGSHYSQAFKPEEKMTMPDPTIPPLFTAVSGNKNHTDTQKSLTNIFGTFIDTMCDAICGVWGTWQSAASMVGIIVNAVTATGGQIVGPPWTPLLLAQGPKGSPAQLKYTKVIAQVIGTAWQTYTATVKCPGLPWYPAFAAMPSPVAPPTPNIPAPVIALTQVTVAVSCNMMKQQMIAQLGDPQAQYASELFESLCDAFEKCFTVWQASTMVTNVIGTGPVPTFAPPYVPAGPVIGGIATMAPGGLV